MNHQRFPGRCWKKKTIPLQLKPEAVDSSQPEKPSADVEMQPAPKSEAAFEDTWPADPGPSPLVAAEAEQTEQPELPPEVPRKEEKKHWKMCEGYQHISPFKGTFPEDFHFPKVGYASSQEGSEGVDWLTQMMG